MTQPQSSSEIKTDKLPEILPILPMIDATLFPGQSTFVDVAYPLPDIRLEFDRARPV